jgi:hypothetical protein
MDQNLRWKVLDKVVYDMQFERECRVLLLDLGMESLAPSRWCYKPGFGQLIDY